MELSFDDMQLRAKGKAYKANGAVTTPIINTLLN